MTSLSTQHTNQESNESFSSPKARSLRGIVFAFIGAACWGFSANCVSWLTTFTDADVLWLGTMRLIIAGSLFLILALIRNRQGMLLMLRTPRYLWLLILYTIFGVILMQVAYMSAIKYTDPGTALLLQESGVPLILILTCFRMRRLPKALEVVALLLAVFGIVMISTQGDISTLNINPQGLFWGLASGVALAGYNLASQELIEKCGLLPLNALSMLIGALVLTPLVRPWESNVSLGLEGWAVFGGVVIIGTMLAYALYLRGVKDAGVVKASLIGVFEPVSGAIIAALWLGTIFSSWDFIGGIAIIVMMIIVAKQK